MSDGTFQNLGPQSTSAASRGNQPDQEKKSVGEIGCHYTSYDESTLEPGLTS